MSNKTGLAMDVVTATEIWKRAKQGKVQGCETMTLEDAKIVLADAYLAQLREDDGELVPEGSFTEHDSGNVTCSVNRLWEEPENDMEGFYYWYTVFIWDGGELILDSMDQPTMGQLRHLIRGLGGEA